MPLRNGLSRDLADLFIGGGARRAAALSIQ
jgi:hypothetical protein